MAGAMNKANARQSHKRKGYYAAQHDKTKVNKIITQARHIAVYGDARAMTRFKQAVAVDKHRAFQKTKSQKIKDVITASY